MANVNFKRGNNATMNATDITDGLIFLNTEDRQIYFDNGTERLQYGGDTTLVSDTSSASDDTAFTSNATVNIFTQQDTIVDSKANALAVTQNHIPLGCLAFSETIGTEDFSSIGDGTVSGALVDLNSRLSDVGTFPDYSSITPVVTSAIYLTSTAQTIFTAEEDGFFAITAMIYSSNASSGVYLYCGDDFMYEIFPTLINNNCYVRTQLFPVKAGDVIKAKVKNSSVSSATFVSDGYFWTVR